MGTLFKQPDRTRIALEDLTDLADLLQRWSYVDPDRHPKDRLTDHQALDIALRLHKVNVDQADRDVRDEQLAGFGEILQSIAARIGK